MDFSLFDVIFLYYIYIFLYNLILYDIILNRYLK